MGYFNDKGAGFVVKREKYLSPLRSVAGIGFESYLFRVLDVVYLCCIFMLYINERKLVDRYENSCDNRSIEWYGT